MKLRYYGGKPEDCFWVNAGDVSRVEPAGRVLGQDSPLAQAGATVISFRASSRWIAVDGGIDSVARALYEGLCHRQAHRSG